MKIEKIVSGYAGSNTYFISKNNKMIVIDPCLEINNDPKKLLEKIEGFEVVGILLTHGHFDHVSGVDAIVEKTNTKVFIYKDEKDWPKDPQLNLSTMIPELVRIQAEMTPIDLGKLTIDTFTFDVIHTPGHTHGSVSYIIDQHVFDGDFIFKDSVGRMDLPTGSETEMRDAISLFIQKYEDEDYILYPGHGMKTTLENEINHNPFIKHLGAI